MVAILTLTTNYAWKFVQLTVATSSYFTVLYAKIQHFERFRYDKDSHPFRTRVFNVLMASAKSNLI